MPPKTLLGKLSFLESIIIFSEQIGKTFAVYYSKRR
jgi:hypothetical protein